MSPTDHANLLRRRFVRCVLAQRPASVLDVGTGPGGVLRALHRAGVRTGAVEADGERVAALANEGFAVARATADHLPFPDDSFDWVVMRHVAHHLEDPRAAMAEMARVARTGLVVAEPWREPGLPEQEVGTRLDRWTRRQDRRLGRVHEDDLSPLVLRGMLPDPDAWQVEVDFFQGPGLRDLDSVRTSIEERLVGLPEDSDERSEALAVLAEAERVGVGVNGSATVAARFAGAAHPRPIELPLADGAVVHVRPAREEDVPTLVELLADDPLGAQREDAAAASSDAYLGAFRLVDDNPFQELVVAERDGRVVGTLQLSYLHGLSRGGATRAQIEAVRVASSSRGSGLGTALVGWAVERARQRGCALVQLTTDKSRTRALPFYESLGFIASHEGMKRLFDPT